MEKSYQNLRSNYKPTRRQLRGYAFDPSLSNSLGLATINSTTFNIRWEENLAKGPVGEYLEVIDFDPASNIFYHQVNLNDPYILAQNGLAPSEGNPLFHQQMVYAVAMLTIQNFEKALGRVTLWSSRDYTRDEPEKFVPRLRIYPHALREANAYYSPSKKAILFGYFPANPKKENVIMPGSLVFTCLSHDIITHEVTHALIDGLYKRYMIASHEDTLALHEGFSDIVALFQHFTFTDVLVHQIAKTRGKFEGNQILSELAQQFGLAIGNYGALRGAIGKIDDKDGVWKPSIPDVMAYKTKKEPHERGSILVAAVFDAFVNIYNERVRDLYRIATNGTGELPAGEIHPDLVRRLAEEASRTARQVLTMCIRALDYCPPINVTFGDYLRGIITADLDVVPFDSANYRVAFVESFKRWGIYPIGIRTLSVDSLSYSPEFKSILDSDKNKNLEDTLDCYDNLEKILKDYFNKIGETYTREEVFEENKKARLIIHSILVKLTDGDRSKFETLTGLVFSNNGNHWDIEDLPENIVEMMDGNEKKTSKFFTRSFNKNDFEGSTFIKRIIVEAKENDGKLSPSIEVHSIHRSQRVGPDGRIVNHIILTLLQKAIVEYQEVGSENIQILESFKAGCTIVISMAGNDEIKVIKKPINDIERIQNQIIYQQTQNEDGSPFSSKMKASMRVNEEPFAALHSS